MTYTESAIENIYDMAAGSYPGTVDLKPLIKYDINIYKLIYNTTVDGKLIKASGLVCTPATPGEYPVLSFQNGTNTVNVYAPSEFITNPSYQMIEFISSMGFVVVIPDYPGFGKSSDIPHPYLIEEPTVGSVVNMLRAVKEAAGSELKGLQLKNEYYLMGYSQGGWATLATHKALEMDYSSEFTLAGSVCGAGPYDIYKLLLGMVNFTEYPMPSYIGYIINAYTYYNQFTNPVAGILNEPYASRVSTLFKGTLTLGQINNQLTTSIPGLLKADFLSGFATSSDYASVRSALMNNSVSAWNTNIPLYFIHGEGDADVSVNSTLIMYDAMIEAGTSSLVCRKLIIPLLDHGGAVVPAMTEGLHFIIGLRDN
jgi:pimeloyl-ACP methyl ester carboxylesterase